MGDEVRKRLFTGFGEMHFESCPEGTALFAQVGFRIIRRVDVQGGGRNIVCISSSQLPILHPVVLDPDLAQDLDRRDFSQRSFMSVFPCG
jgi:hypothetical protein